MITISPLSRQPLEPSDAPGWQRELADAITSPAELLRLLELPQEPAVELPQFPLLVPRSFVARMRKRAPGLLQKYFGRALLIATAACAVHCRYCFRRDFPYADQIDDGGRWARAVRPRSISRCCCAASTTMPRP